MPRGVSNTATRKEKVAPDIQDQYLSMELSVPTCGMHVVRDEWINFQLFMHLVMCAIMGWIWIKIQDKGNMLCLILCPLFGRLKSNWKDKICIHESVS